MIYTLCAVLGVCFVAVSTKKLKNLHFSVLLTWYSIFTIIVMSIVLFVRYQCTKHDEGVQVPLSYPDLSTYLLIIITCLIHAVATSLMTITTQHSSPSLVNLISYTGIIYNFLLDVFYFAVQFTRL